MKPLNIVLAGVPGNMSKRIGIGILEQECLKGDMTLCHYALSEISGDGIDVGRRIILQGVPMGDQEAFLLAPEREPIDLIVDFTQPQSVVRNAELYCRAGIPFVMGTTGGDRKRLIEVVQSSAISAVIAANMAVPVILFQDMIRHAAESFPGSLEGYKLNIWESHQGSKPDPSGTAVSLLEFFEKLGIPFTKEQITMVRDPVYQESELGIPEEFLGGHGYHTYTLVSPDGTVTLKFTHNVLGRDVYVDGALRAIRFLAKQQGVKGRVFSMQDVLRGVAA